MNLDPTFSLHIPFPYPFCDPVGQTDGIMTLNEKEDVAIPETAQESPAVSAQFPDGGLKAWLVVVGGFLTYFVTFG